MPRQSVVRVAWSQCSRAISCDGSAMTTVPPVQTPSKATERFTPGTQPNSRVYSALGGVQSYLIGLRARLASCLRVRLKDTGASSVVTSRARIRLAMQSNYNSIPDYDHARRKPKATPLNQ